jgi:hypothetical protein
MEIFITDFITFGAFIVPIWAVAFVVYSEWNTIKKYVKKRFSQKTQTPQVDSESAKTVASDKLSLYGQFASLPVMTIVFSVLTDSADEYIDADERYRLDLSKVKQGFARLVSTATEYNKD